ncbi:uncharacterized protein BBA_10004 [Beauveria bassiana ARSEF 2860]|uniref:Uncharacterized protein n=1 Tax=Beauveria bassiana (strain ARSEF 2860) TaxID=655819 RepID=J4VQU5_BEAB2|nr:uncharacterized protein BBA_10004 [Beauveria bassiana ARSEF 2860]EJP61045.1 hypothetical protein BBA_10004 [Beauveria bassiana ARSEF 2860]
MSSRAPPPPPPPPAPSGSRRSAAGDPVLPKPPSVSLKGPAGAFLVELLIYNGSPFKDHWAYWICSHHDLETGVLVHATGDVRNGFQFEIKRSHDFRATGNRPSKRIPLQWVDGEYFNEAAMFNHGIRKIDTLPVCAFEASLHKIEAPGKTLNTVDDKTAPGKKITQRNCQTWVIESANQLVMDSILTPAVVAYLRGIEQ